MVFHFRRFCHSFRTGHMASRNVTSGDAPEVRLIAQLMLADWSFSRRSSPPTNSNEEVEPQEEDVCYFATRIWQVLQKQQISTENMEGHESVARRHRKVWLLQRRTTRSAAPKRGRRQLHSKCCGAAGGIGGDGPELLGQGVPGE